VANWYIFPILVCCAKKNLATLVLAHIQSNNWAPIKLIHIKMHFKLRTEASQCTPWRDSNPRSWGSDAAAMTIASRRQSFLGRSFLYNFDLWWISSSVFPSLIHEAFHSTQTTIHRYIGFNLCPRPQSTDTLDSIFVLDPNPPIHLSYLVIQTP
jgi:hypothetical protein